MKTFKVMAVAAVGLAIGVLHAQQSNPLTQLFDMFDSSKSGSLTRDGLKATFNAWFTQWDTAKTGSITRTDFTAGLAKQFPAPPPGAPVPACQVGVNTFSTTGNTTPLVACDDEVAAMMAALPKTPGAKPKKARKILVYAHSGAGGFVHASIPLAAKMVEGLGNQGKLWTTTVTYNPADINAENLKQYDAIFLDSTTGCFLDDADPKVTAARRAAFLDFVRGGKGIAGVHAATDSYHSDCIAASAAAGRGPAPGGAPTNGMATTIATVIAGQADANNDQKVTREEMMALADSWFDRLDPNKTGKVSAAEFATRATTVLSGGGRGAGGRGGSGRGAAPAAPAAPPLQWPEFNKLIGGYFKFHWVDPQLITTKIDDPKSPLTAMFHGKEFEIHDETYTFAQDSFSRKNVHVLTSVDYDKMSAEDKAAEGSPRTDHDFALSYIRAEGKGRVFYEAHGHSPRVYAMTPMLEHYRAGIQYVLGDLKADDSPSVK